jgi:SAM-dependent methyltransferase
MSNGTPSLAATARATCRFCRAPLSKTFVDLGMSPLCQTHIEPHQLNHMERFYPLHAWVCESCWLVQLEEYVSPDQIFSDYAYFSSYSDSWVEHARRYVEAMIQRWGLGAQSLVMEIASNDGYLLQHFKARGVPCRGIEPAANVAEAAVAKGIPTTVKFFGKRTAEEIASEFGQPDLLLGNNVLAHVPDINDFVSGMHVLLKRGGVITMEFPHLLKLMDENQFDTIYHEHFSYLSFGTVEKIFAHHQLRLFDVDRIPTHGGSLRIYACHQDDASHPTLPSVDALRNEEIERGLQSIAAYAALSHRCARGG